jgi:hypothetical protein
VTNVKEESEKLAKVDILSSNAAQQSAKMAKRG